VPAAAGVTILRIEHRPLDWESETFRRRVLDSDARWVLWTEEGEPEEFGDLLPLFEDERTFAVSRQSDYRGWKSGLMPTSAFRALQPGESSRVVAPLGRTIIADRRKLAALGIPDCVFPQTSWLLLFWKAAAAGWRSYSLGGDQRLGEQPDFPQSETEFFWHWLLSPELRRLGPAEEDGARGTIAFRPGGFPGARRDTSRMRVLIVSPFLPFPLSHGGAVRIYNLCRALAPHVDFRLVAIRERQDRVYYPELEQVFRDVCVVDMDELPAADEGEPKQVRESQSRSLRAAISEVAQTWQPDLVQIEYTHLAGYRTEDLGIPAILVEHDLTWTLYRQIAGHDGNAASVREMEAWHRFEQRHLRAYEGVWTVSEEERQLAIAEGSNPGTTFVIPNGVDLWRFQREARYEAVAAAPEVLFVGSFRHLPNLLGFDKLLREVMPRVWKMLPQVRVRVVGGPRHDFYWEQFRRNSGSWQGGLDRRVDLHGFVEDLRPFYRDAGVVVVPLEVSAGTNIKVMEAMACGKAVVSTPVGSAGLGLRPGYDALICADWSDFANAVCELIRNPELCERIARQARQTVEERFGWESIAERAYQAYGAVLERQKHAALMPY
jgi:glycosyltransferase involved in cell wall biosynthesis